MKYRGLDITIEYPAGSFKPDKDTVLSGFGWFIYADYGYINNTMLAEPGED